MRKFLLFISILLMTQQLLLAECQERRYKEKIFDQLITIKDVKYGSNKNNAGEQQDLFYDVYMPDPGTDTLAKRPVIIFVHGGSYIGGAKDVSMIRNMCREFAARGYVSISIQYRLEKATGALDPIIQFADKSNWYKAIIRSTHDIKGAIRYIKRGVAEEGNPYHIDTNNLTLYGSSAGAIGVLHSMFLDETDVLNNFWTWAVGDLGGIEGYTNEYYQYGSINTVRNLILNSGALAFSDWIQDKNDVDVLALHHKLDPSVPYGHGCFYTAMCHLGRFDGTSVYGPVLQNLGARVEMYPVEGIGHPVDDLLPEFVLEKAVDFMYASQCKYDTTVFEVPTGIYTKSTTELKLYPNPNSGEFTLSVKDFKANSSVSIHSLSGQILYEGKIKNLTQKIQFDAPQGMYLIILTDDTGSRSATKLFIQ